MVASGWAGMETDAETVYVAFNTQVIAINLANGAEKWRFPAEPDPKVTFYAAPALSPDGQLIVGGYDHVLYSLNPANGQLNWKFEGADGRYIGSPLVTEVGIYAPSADHKLYALTLDGSPLWDKPFESSEPLWATPAADQDCGCVFVPSMDHKVYALEAKTGRLLWATNDLGGAIVGSPLITGDQRLFVGTFAKEMVALDAETGRELWRFGVQDWIWSKPALADTQLFFGDLSGTFYAVDAERGQILWQLQPGGSIVGTPLITEEGIFFTTEDGNLVSLTLDGKIRWQQTLEDSLYAGPKSAADMILITSSNPENLLIAMDQNGLKKWSFGIDK